MRKSLKIASAALVLLLVLGVAVVVYAGMQNGLAQASDQQTDNQYPPMLHDWNNVTPPNSAAWPCLGDRNYGRQTIEDGLQLFQLLSENATLSTVQGTLVSQLRSLLILNTDSGQVRVIVPNEWTVGTETVDRTTLFNGTFVSAGQSLTVNVLKSDLFSNTNLSVNVMLAYETVNTTGTHAYAVLPFNIQPTT